ncbi:MAG: DNA polymerase III subunit delta' [Candidatus Omnitrophica bacterium]|nr:DNA polymerase III subunit delta' [Candidatus Omnitrophota bacterium]MBU0881018.1 DNA polymerase III subunit delta' [Candidatus Omnitrophota bacterium]MBU1808744.1 DNA polymerase III subunit delta' [Candidatus Omnitrophota bacterium]
MSFKDIKGNDAVISFLIESSATGRVANAYIFSGPDGIGKKLSALAFAKAINCLSPNEGVSCDKCPSCKKIDSSNHPDVFIVAPEKKGTTIKIDDIRVVIKDNGLKPYEAKVKVYIIDEADGLTDEAANALLKTLEEPSMASMLILITERPSRLLPTIRSRCQIVNFFPLDAAMVEEILTASHNIDGVKARLLGRISCGSPGRALELEDNDFFDKRERIIKALSSDTFSYLDFDKTPRSDLRAILNIMLTWYRDIMVMKAGDGKLMNVDKKELISTEADRIGFEKLDNVLKRIMLTQTYLDQSANPKLAITALGLAL